MALYEGLSVCRFSAGRASKVLVFIFILTVFWVVSIVSLLVSIQWVGWWEPKMDEKCDICKRVIGVNDARFYVVYSSRECYRESWEVIGYICPRCFLQAKLISQKERG